MRVSLPAMPRWLGLACRLALGGLFLYAALLKIGDPAAFAKDIANYRLLPESWATAAAYLIPCLEVVVALGLITGIWLRGAALWASGLMLVFIAALVVNLARGLDIDCGCFGSGESDPVTALYRDLALLPLCAATLWAGFGRPR